MALYKCIIIIIIIIKDTVRNKTHQLCPENVETIAFLPVSVRLFETRADMIREVESTLPVVRSRRTSHDAGTRITNLRHISDIIN